MRKSKALYVGALLFLMAVAIIDHLKQDHTQNHISVGEGTTDKRPFPFATLTK